MGILSSLIVLLYTFIVYPFGRRSFRVWAANEITFQFAKWLKRSHRFIGAVGDPDNTGVINPNPLYADCQPYRYILNVENRICCAI